MGTWGAPRRIGENVHKAVKCASTAAKRLSQTQVQVAYFTMAKARAVYRARKYGTYKRKREQALVFSRLGDVFEKGTRKLPSKSNLPADQRVFEPEGSKVVPSAHIEVCQISFASNHARFTHMHTPKVMRITSDFPVGGPGIVQAEERRVGGHPGPCT